MGRSANGVRSTATPISIPRLITLAEAADLLSVSRRTVARWIEDGRVRAAKLSASPRGAIRAYAEDIAALVEEATRREASEGCRRRSRSA